MKDYTGAAVYRMETGQPVYISHHGKETIYR
jgi:hypothetical protein